MNTRLAKLKHRILGGPTTEGEQSILRLAIGVLISLYVFNVTEPGPRQSELIIYFLICFYIYSLLLIVWLYIDNGVAPLRYHIIVILDVTCTGLTLYVCGIHGMPIVFLFVWLNLGYAYRFGIYYMWLCSIYSMVWITGLYFVVAQYYLPDITVYIGIMLIVIVLSSYLHIFLSRGLKVKEKLILVSEENRKLLEKNLSAMEDVSMKVATDLHDMLGQDFVAIRNFAQLAESKIRSQNNETTQASINYIREIVKIGSKLQSTIKDMLKQIYPETLKELGLIASIRELIFTTQKSNPSITFRVTTTTDRFSFFGKNDIQVYRIIQEAITNILKHADASIVEITFDEQVNNGKNSLRVLIKDNGIGIHEGNSTGQKGLGLISMRERTNTLCGELRIDSGRNGTEINLTVPIGDTHSDLS